MSPGSEKTGNESGEPEMAGESVDTAAMFETTDGKLYIDAGPLYVGFADGVSGGIRLIQDGDFAVLVQGIDYEDGDRATVGNDLTADQCRELADALESAADSMESSETIDNTERDGLLDRIVRAVR